MIISKSSDWFAIAKDQCYSPDILKPRFHMVWYHHLMNGVVLITPSVNLKHSVLRNIKIYRVDKSTCQTIHSNANNINLINKVVA